MLDDGSNADPHLPVLDMPYRHVVSIGCSCQTAWQIENAGLRRYSGPFDWVFSSPLLVQHCLDDDFSTFLDRPNYVQGSSRTQWSPRIYVEGLSQAVMFNHHDMGIDEDYERIVRTVERFRRLLVLPDRKLFVMTVPYGLLDQASRLALVETFSRHTTNFRILLLGVEAALKDVSGQDAGRLPLASCDLRDATHEAWRFQPVSTNPDGLGYMDPGDNQAVRALLRGLQGC